MAQNSPTGQHPASKTSISLAEQRTERERKWAEKRLKSIGKGGALDNLRANAFSYTPFEMSLLVSPEEAGGAVEMRITRFARVFDSLRNMLIIVPILLTWTSLALASSAYEQSLSAKKPNTEPFLQQWQEGFTTLTSVSIWRWHVPLILNKSHWFTFSGFALTDATILGALLLMTIVGQALEVWAYQRATRLVRFLSTYLYDLSVKALGPMAAGPDDKMPPWLRELRTDLGRLSDIISKMNSALDDSMQSYTDALAQQEEAVRALMDDTDKVHDSVVQLKDLFQGGAEAARIYQKYIPHISGDFATMATSQQRSAESMQLMTEMLSKSMLYLGELAGKLQDAETTMSRYQEFLNAVPGRPYPSPPRRQTFWQRNDARSSYGAPIMWDRQPSNTGRRRAYRSDSFPLDAVPSDEPRADGRESLEYEQTAERPKPNLIHKVLSLRPGSRK